MTVYRGDDQHNTSSSTFLCLPSVPSVIEIENSATRGQATADGNTIGIRMHKKATAWLLVSVLGEALVERVWLVPDTTFYAALIPHHEA